MNSHTTAPSNDPLLDETIGANLEAVVTRFGDREALIDVPTAKKWTYSELNRDIDRVATGLLGIGIDKGDRIGMWALNCPEWVMVQYATAKIGAILVNVNPAYRTSELEFVVNQSGMKAIVVGPADNNSDYPALARTVGCKRILIGSDPEPGELTFASLLEQSVDSDAIVERAATLVAGDPINIQYTSGTTGFPKGATLSHYNILNNAYFVGELVGYTEEDRLVVPVPFYHCFGMVMATLATFAHGGTLIIPSRSFNPTAALQAVNDHHATSLYGVPTMFIAELALPNFADFDLSTLRTGIMAGSPCPVEVMKRVEGEMNMSEVAISYGMTETSPVSTMTRVDDDLDRRTTTVGRTMPHLETSIVDPLTGSIVERGETGELCTRGYSVMLGYWEEPERTAEAIDNDGWMHTGDLATMDEAGYVSIVGRIKDMVIRGGENIYPREIEEFLYGHPDIQDVQVIGVPDERYGEELMAWIILKPDADPVTVERVAEFCAGRLAHYKVPRYIKLVEEFPMTVSGKIRKVEMRQVAANQLATAGEVGDVPVAALVGVDVA